jgi:murein DD-endopeptidase MepM/ murein hydrolase activator NlpD
VPHSVTRSLAALALALLAGLPSAATAIAVDGPRTTWIWPTTGRVTQEFGCTGFWAEPRRGSCAHFHSGMDIANGRGTPIRAVASGTVELVGWDPWIHPDPDWMVIIDHGNGLRTMYAHMRAKPVDGITRGAHVFGGQLIGLMDMTGRATGPHLHFAVYLTGEPVDPTSYIAGDPAPPAGAAGPPYCIPVLDSNGVGAGLDGRFAMPKPIDHFVPCTA